MQSSADLNAQPVKVVKEEAMDAKADAEEARQAKMGPQVRGNFKKLQGKASLPSLLKATKMSSA